MALALSAETTGSPTMLIRVTCPRGHAGVVSAEMPRDLTCSQCGAIRRVEVDRSERIISTERRIENVNAILAAAR
jgi:hypothetical protein